MFVEPAYFHTNFPDSPNKIPIKLKKIVKNRTENVESHGSLNLLDLQLSKKQYFILCSK